MMLRTIRDGTYLPVGAGVVVGPGGAGVGVVVVVIRYLAPYKNVEYNSRQFLIIV